MTYEEESNNDVKLGMKLGLVIGIFILMLAYVSASDPLIDNIDFEQPFVNKEVTFIVTIDPADMNGVIRFVDNGYLITQQLFNPETSQLTFKYTWNVKEIRTIKFYMADLNDLDDDLTNNTIEENISIKTGIDLGVDEFIITPTTITPNAVSQFSYKAKNLGDDLYLGNVAVTVTVDGNDVCSSIIDMNNNLWGSCNWTPTTRKDSYNIVATINKNNIIDEFSYTNNTKTLTVSGSQKPDLIIDSIEPESEIRRGMIGNIAITLKNNGGIDTLNPILDVYASYDGVEGKIFSQEIASIRKGQSVGVNVVYIFQNIGKYTIRAVIDKNNQIEETIETNNEFSVSVKVVDFNLSDIIKENDQLRKDIGTKEGQVSACETEKSSLKTSIINLEEQSKSCQSNLDICNTNNSTKIANWMKDMDANKESLNQIYLAQISQTKTDYEGKLSEARLEKANAEAEKSQWSMLCLVMVCSYVAWLVYEQYIKRRPRKGIGTGSIGVNTV